MNLLALLAEKNVIDEALRESVESSAAESGLSYEKALIDAGVHIGLPRDIAEKLVIETTLGSTKTIKEMKKHPAELKNMVTSPGGTTAEGILQLEMGGLRSLLLRTVMAAYEKSQDLGSKKQ